jgi:hypothetical protein
MQKSDDLRKRAENCADLAEHATNAAEKRRLKRLSEGWQEAAQNQDWLDGAAEGSKEQ